MITAINEYAQQATTVVILPVEDTQDMFSISFIKQGNPTRIIGQMRLTASDALELVNEEDAVNESICVFDRIVLIDTLRRHLSAMKNTESDINSVFVNGRAVSVKLLLTTNGVEETITAIFDRDNEELILQPGNIEDAKPSFAQWQIKGDYIHLDKETINKIQLNLKLNHLERTDPECLIAAFCDFYDYIQETK